ncbi:MAG: trans-2-enoyl-CoA reductase family protein [Spirochaetales bacterium]|nr:trans-2-enoyl-CoA reductase family protein [Spirochaetales bacterium]
MIITPKVRNNIFINAHPVGCRVEVERQISYARENGPIGGAKKVLVIGCSSGFGLASRIVSAFGCGADTVGVMYEREGTEARTATPGWYNTKTFESHAREDGLFAQTVNGDAFSNDVKKETIALVKEHLGYVDLIVYSLASPVRTDPADGTLYRSVLKPIGSSYQAKAVDAMSWEVTETDIEPANDEEIKATVKVMGGEDWALWIDALLAENLVAPGCKTVAYSYIGPEVTYPIYRSGTIGKAKEHLESTVDILNKKLAPCDARAVVSVNKALVTKASAVIPVVPLYIALLYRVMKELGNHEGCIEQIVRLYRDRLYGDGPMLLDEAGRIRIDDWEMSDEVQNRVSALWEQATSENLKDLGDLDGYKKDFLNLNGFDVDGVDYSQDVTDF